MRVLLLLIILPIVSVFAAPTVETRDWQPACDGSSVEIVRENGRVISIHATAFHFHLITEWSIPFVDGKPVSAEYRESKRVRFKSGEHAGEPTGDVVLQKVAISVPFNGRFSLNDRALSKELDQLLTIANIRNY